MVSVLVGHTNFTLNTFIFGGPNIKFGGWSYKLHIEPTLSLDVRFGLSHFILACDGRQLKPVLNFGVSSIL